MALALRYAVRSDVGLLREGNEDSAYAGPHLLAVADGMGGYAAGEVASSAVISAIAGLDAQDVPEPELAAALAAAVRKAKESLREIVDSDPAVGSMGTTLTAMLLSGSSIALCHIGDSRAYLLRDTDLYQITKDHTFVQALVDQGRITLDEVATHPQRSLLLRALDGRSDADPDISVLAARPGDRYLLCSDGLPVAVSDDLLLDALTAVSEPEDLVLKLVELAISGGGPDNITCIVADVIDTATTSARPTQAVIAAGAASAGVGHATRPVTQPAGMPPAGRAPDRHEFTQLASSPAITRADGIASPAEAGGRAPGRRGAPAAGEGGRASGPDEQAPPGRRRWPVVTTVLVVLLLLVGGGLLAGYSYVRSQYYVGVDRGNVAIYRGVNDRVLGVSLSSVSERTSIPLAGVPRSDVAAIRSTIAPGGRAQADRVVANIRRDYVACRTAYAALRTWIAGKPKPVKVKVRVNGKLVTRTKIPPYHKIQPVIPAGCPPEPLPPS